MVKGDNNKRKKELFMSFQRYDYPIDSGKELANKKFKDWCVTCTLGVLQMSNRMVARRRRDMWWRVASALAKS